MLTPTFIKHSSPFPWADFSGSIELVTIDKLVTELDGLEFRKVSRDSGTDKAYSFDVCTLVKDSQVIKESIPPNWKELVNVFCGENYTNLLRQVFEFPDNNVLIDMEVFKYRDNDWIGPHTDRPNRLVTHLYYLNKSWDAASGGILHLLSGPREDLVAKTIVPEAPTSVAFVRSDDSWHYVTPVLGPRERISFRVDIKQAK